MQGEELISYGPGAPPTFDQEAQERVAGHLFALLQKSQQAVRNTIRSARKVSCNHVLRFAVGSNPARGRKESAPRLGIIQNFAQSLTISLSK